MVPAPEGTVSVGVLTTEGAYQIPSTHMNSGDGRVFGGQEAVEGVSDEVGVKVGGSIEVGVSVGACNGSLSGASATGVVGVATGVVGVVTGAMGAIEGHSAVEHGEYDVGQFKALVQSRVHDVTLRLDTAESDVFEQKSSPEKLNPSVFNVVLVVGMSPDNDVYDALNDVNTLPLNRDGGRVPLR